MYVIFSIVVYSIGRRRGERGGDEVVDADLEVGGRDGAGLEDFGAGEVGHWEERPMLFFSLLSKSPVLSIHRRTCGCLNTGGLMYDHQG